MCRIYHSVIKQNINKQHQQNSITYQNQRFKHIFFFFFLAKVLESMINTYLIQFELNSPTTYGEMLHLMPGSLFGRF